MLLNLTNHASSQWPEKQYNQAVELYQEIVDLSFPQISPMLDTNELDTLIESYENMVRKINPSVVHIMGEMTFTFRLVKRLQAFGIPCIASTTERKVVESYGIKTSIFEFVQFRNY
jgi:hypothetical protein